MDRLFLNAILQRLKISPEHFVIALSTEEYEYLEIRAEIIRYVQDKEWDKAIGHTVPDYDNKLIDYSLLSTDEILIILSLFQLKQDMDGRIGLEAVESLMPLCLKVSMKNVLSGAQIPDMFLACTINFGQSVELIGEIIKKGRKEA